MSDSAQLRHAHGPPLYMYWQSFVLLNAEAFAVNIIVAVNRSSDGLPQPRISQKSDLSLDMGQTRRAPYP
eukprot:6214458-Pleurochrysis_carterae.AAC.1